MSWCHRQTRTAEGILKKESVKSIRWSHRAFYHALRDIRVEFSSLLLNSSFKRD
ncbi:uncharacterized protein PHALS_03004 [Plasmopara halstedii]|uniref:Uncharacterized protein n=1 Tax=Plasmopara halstedii TaxID=4781 RepID=A0A0P1A8R9_PLAHL|nr:uncharacterized protein PHALS_03004 [Plasmopara halstedii]CEG36454.1 hypothetical protein PHALS_03004 [Plasmopara halstedii]|eukprot:XP_024572823.1 hypothetical protein PHALS_03004 [Plasmopara halstedii]